MRKRRQLKGTAVVIHKSLCEEVMIAGCPRKLFFLNAGCGIIFGFAAGAIYLIPIFFLTHQAIVRMHKNDPLYFKCLIRFFSVCYYRRYYTT